jgi:hypothetical protein
MMNLVQKVEGLGQLFGMEVSPLGPISKSYDGRVYIGNSVFDFRSRYRTCQIGII